MPNSPEERLSALEETTKNQASQLNDLSKQLTDLTTQFQAQTDGLNEQNAKMDEILEAVKTSSQAAPPDPTKEPEAPKAKDEAEAPASEVSDALESGLTKDEIAQAVRDATSGAIDELKSEIEELKAGNFEASRTMQPDADDDVQSSAKVGDEGGEGSSKKITTYAQMFQADKEVNPEGWAIDEVPKGEAGLRALRNMEMRYGNETSFDSAAFDHQPKLGGNEFPRVRARRHQISV